MKLTKIRQLFLLLFCLAGASADSQFISSPSGTDCGLILVGGSYYHLLDPDYDNKSLYAFDPNDKPIVRRSVYSVGVEPFNDPKLSRSCAYIAFLEPNQARNALGIRLITAEGQDRSLLPGVLCFDWGTNAANDDLLAYVVGPPQPEDSEKPPTGALWIRNINTDERWKIHPGGFLVTWAGFDSSFYIEELFGEDDKTRVLRYDCKSKKIERTPYLGSCFSTGGTYYYVYEVDGDGFRLFDRVKNVDITQEFRELYEHVPYGRVSPVGWISDSMLALHSKPARSEDGRATQQIINFKNSQLWEVEPEVVGLRRQGGQDLVQVTKSGVTVRPFSEVAKLVCPAR